MSPKSKKKKLNPRVLAVQEQKKRKMLLIAFFVTGAIIVGLIGYAVVYSVFLKDNIAVATIDGQDVDNEFYKARVRMERNGYIQQYLMLNVQSQIFAEDPNQAAYYQEQMMQIASVLDSVGLFGEMVLNKLIEDEIIVIKGREMGLEVSDTEVDALLQRLFNYYPDGTPTPAPTRLPFEVPPVTATQEAILDIEPTSVVDAIEIESGGEIGDIAAVPTETPAVDPTATVAVPTKTPGATATPFTDDMFQEEYDNYLGEMDAINVSEEHLRTYLYYYLFTNKIREAVIEAVPTQQEQVWARHILVASRPEAMIVLNRLESESWNNVAADVSLDTSNKDAGGDLGWFSSGQMVTAFNDAVFAMEVGQVSDPVETQFGWHIIQLVDSATLPLVQADLENKQNQAYDIWLMDAKDSIDYEINEVYIDIAPADPTITEFIEAAEATQSAE